MFCELPAMPPPWERVTSTKVYSTLVSSDVFIMSHLIPLYGIIYFSFNDATYENWTIIVYSILNTLKK